MTQPPITRLAVAALAGIMLAACQPDTAKTGADTKAAEQLTIPPLKPVMRTLANGLRVYEMPDSNTASVSVAVWYDVGGKNDPAGRSGFAHLFEHLMFKSTKDMPPENMDKLTEYVGGFNNASTWNDFTNYYETVPANYLQSVLWAEAERMGSLVVDDANFKSERDVVKEELRQSVLSRPYGKLFNLYLPEANFDVHPYGRPVIGSISDLDSATIGDVRAFHAAYYRPDNAILVVSGNFDTAKVDSWIDTYFGPVTTPKRPIPRVTAVEPVRTAPKSLTVYEPNTPLPAVVVSWPGLAPDSPDLAAWMILDAILQRGQDSRLYNAMVYDQKLAAEVESNFEVTQQAGVYALIAILSEGKSADDGLKSLNAEVAKMRDAPVTDAELEEARNELITEALESRETSDGRAFELARSVILFNDPAASDKLLAKLQTVTAADVQRVAKEVMDDSHSVTIRYLPEALAKGAKSDVIAPAATIETTKIDIPASEIPVYALAPEGQREQAPAPGPAVAVNVPSASEKTLANGLRVIVANKPGLPLVSADLRIAAGGALDTQAKAGLATLTADLATRGTATRSATDISRQIESLGASLSAGAGADSTDVSLRTRSDKTKDIFAIMADVVQNPAFKDEELARARQETLDGLMVSLRQPSSVGRYAMTRRLYGDGPYGSVPSPKSIAALTPADASAFHAEWWRPDNAILVITGDVTPEDGFSLAESALGAWKKPDAAMPAPSASATATTSNTPLVIDIPKIGQAAVLMGQTGPARTAPDYFPTLVANDVLGGGYSARLNEEIRIKRGLSYGASSRIASRKDAAPIIAAAQTRNDAVPQVVQLMSGEMAKLGASTIPADEMDARKATLIGSFGRSVETTAGLAGQLSELAQFNLPLDKLRTYTSDISAVTPAAAEAAAKAHYSPDTASLVVVGDAKVFGKDLAKAYPKLETIEISKLNLDSATLK